MEWIVVTATFIVMAFILIKVQKAYQKKYVKKRTRKEQENSRYKQENVRKETLQKKEQETKNEPQNNKNNNDFYNYKKNDYLFTRAESVFYKNLVKATEETYIVLNKVRIADLITPDYRNYTGMHGEAFNKISKKHVNFVLINKNNLSIQAAIELDDSSHERTDRRQSDKVKNEAFKNAGIALFRIHKDIDFNPENLKEILGIESPENNRDHNYNLI